MDDKRLNAPTGEKECKDCHKPFTPHSGAQKRCDDCKGAQKPPLEKSTKEVKVKPVATVKTKGSGQVLLTTGQSMLDELGVNKIELEGETITISVRRIVKV